MLDGFTVKNIPRVSLYWLWRNNLKRLHLEMSSILLFQQKELTYLPPPHDHVFFSRYEALWKGFHARPEIWVGYVRCSFRFVWCLRLPSWDIICAHLGPCITSNLCSQGNRPKKSYLLLDILFCFVAVVTLFPQFLVNLWPFFQRWYVTSETTDYLERLLFDKLSILLSTVLWHTPEYLERPAPWNH